MKTLKDLKVGDEVWTIQSGFAPITEINYENPFGIDVGGFSYQMDGKYFDSDIFSSLYLENPFEKKIEGKFMMVSTDGLYWTTNRVIIDNYGEIFVQSGWKFAKEIEPETFTKPITEITLDEIAEKFGIDVKQIKIKL